jgi:DNA-binding NtrC family response regulator
VEGTDLLKEMGENSPEMAKIMLTGYPTVENAIESLNRGAGSFIVKPVAPDKLLEVVKEQLTEQDERGKMSLERVKKWIEQRRPRKKQKNL